MTVAVTAPEEDRVRRLMARDAISEDYARSRIAAQHPENAGSGRDAPILWKTAAREAQFREKCHCFFTEFMYNIGRLLLLSEVQDTYPELEE